METPNSQSYYDKLEQFFTERGLEKGAEYIRKIKKNLADLKTKSASVSAKAEIAALLRAVADELEKAGEPLSVSSSNVSLLRKGVKEQDFQEAMSRLHGLQEKYFPSGSLSLEQDNYGQFYITIYTSIKDDESGRKYHMAPVDFEETDDDFQNGGRKSPNRQLVIE